MSESSLTRKAGRAALWQILGGLWQTLIRIIASMFLARILEPSDFGLFGMALLYQEFIVTALSLGFGTGLIVKKSISEIYLSTSFWMSLLVRIFLFLVIFFSAPLGAFLWKEPKVEPLIRLISLSLLINLIGMIPGILAVKQLEFTKINIIRGISVLLESIIAILLAAIAKLSYWALAVGMLTNVLFYNICLWITERCWIPKPIINKEAFKYLLYYGSYNWGTSITNYLKQHIDYFLVGRILGSYNLGLYEFAYRLPHLIFNRISRQIGSVIFPTLSRVQDDNKRIFIGYIKAVKFITLITFPMLFGLASVADILVPVLWGNKWLVVIKPLQILCLCAALRCLFQPIGFIFLCKKRPDIPFKISIATLLFTVICVSVLGYYYGVIGVSIGMLLSVLPGFIVLYYAFRFILKMDTFLFFSNLYPIIISSLFCGIIAYFTKKIFSLFYLNKKIILILSISSGVLAYILFLFLIFPSLIIEVFKYIELILGKKLNKKWWKLS